jgi:glycerol-3-phosphate dehydrogenase
MSRLDLVRNREFDVVVVGGGIIGAGVARDAALRGLSVALFEKRDYGSGTTAGSTRLIHGGLRYLEMFDFGLVRMDLRERETLLRIAPHLVKPLEFLLPFYDRSLFHRTKMHAGMLLYDALSYDKSLPRYRKLGASEVLEAEPALRREGLQGAVSYFDAQVESPERLCVENVVDARTLGAVALNYVEVTAGLSDARGVTGVRVHDGLEDGDAEVRARVVVNASGPWFNAVAPAIGNDPARVRTTKGVHLACAPLTRRAVVFFSPIDQRLFFTIPLLGLGWVSTTDTDFTGDPSTASADPDDIRYLVESTAEFIPQIRTEPMYWTNAGVRALVMQGGRESDVSRSHRIDSTPGLVSILGGKITGYRAIAEEAVDSVLKQLDRKTPCGTAERLLPGARSQAAAGDLTALVTRAVQEEQCVHLADFMLRRSTLGFRADLGIDIAPQVAQLMRTGLGWTAERTDAEFTDYQGWVQRARGPLMGNPTRHMTV